MRNRERVVGFFLSLCVLGCGQVRDDVALEDLDVMVVDALCEVRVRCGLYPDKRACGQAANVNLQRTASVRAGRAQYDPKAAAACLDAYASLGCRLSEDSHPPEALNACKAMFLGTVEEGGSCLSNAECVSQLCNRSQCGDDACCAGTCQTAVPVRGDCSAPGSVCVESAVCMQFATQAPSICVPMVAAGQPCSAGVVCEQGTICNLAPDSDRGTCGDPPSRGAPCLSGVCDDANDYCDEVSQICLPRGGVGAPCASTDQCVGFARCDVGQGVCVAKSTRGGACTDSTDCVRNLICSSGKCASRPDAPACERKD